MSPDEAHVPGESPAQDSTRETDLQRAKDGWVSKLAITVTAWLTIQSITGLWLYIGSFSLNAQIQLLIHTVIGVVFLVPYVYYQVRHWLVWWRQRVTAAMVLGYLLMTAVLTASVTGIVLSYQAGFERKLGPTWDLVHFVSGIAATALLVAHLTLAWMRRRTVLRKSIETRGLVPRFAGFIAASVALTAMLVTALTLWAKPADMIFEIPEDYGLPEYAQKFEEYEGNPFAPSFARTNNLKLVASELTAGSQSCGSSGCHEEITREWEPSAHRFSAMNYPFQAIQKDFAEDRGAPETRYCAGCHDPISLFAGAKDIHNQELSAPGMAEGISCVGCHSISKVDQRGNADYELTPPEKYLWEGETGARKWISDFLIRAYPRQHLVDYDRNVLRTPEFCGACHKQFIPEALNRFGFSEGQNQYDEWRKSHWNNDDPNLKLTCRDCHMRLVDHSTDPGHGEGGDLRRSTDDGKHRHHGFVAANVFMPELMKLPGWEKHVALTKEFLRGETVIPEIAHVYPKGPVALLRIESPKLAAAGDEIEIRAVLTNRKAGHNYTTGPLDFLRSWIHLVVKDETGLVIAEWGAIDPKTRRIQGSPGQFHDVGNSRKEGTMILGSLPVDDKGEVLRKHQLWRKSGGQGKRSIFPNYSDAQVYGLKIPEGTTGKLKIEAILNYRRYRQEFLDLRLPNMERENGVYQPTVQQSEAKAEIQLTDKKADTNK